ncbi:methyl-accepting chemotaxis protein [Cellulomonas fimi]|uniref:Methyl-accepting chemotaxis sensory transducer n=1 Tax=Cellulomonas fimi (strain ATCC 484 / DSM 20113 / JCM 1341 / CCUG 24087 / LMG 16345 / NBRC 15513 / NCIMB 8980 / NCTC 7547 / NRS-133) TaxID=590998 RepID=F4H214_CELFA|nr:CHASE3 domain-containing protein [Cellulomonas fimi]AEE45184.1 methyl-accepting chemotaxis sensory transducer [Cellulomonas fimi ATCC 484]NNH06254.1 methyl-accepting chemotaxis protein [Cellulomonas fimi]VEH28495.1 Methyl-accepting chemotaxis protein 4 [Cellulomonas fimi]
MSSTLSTSPAPTPHQPRWTWTVGRRLVAGYAVALVLMTGIGVVSFVNTQALVTSSGWVEHTHEVLGETDAILSSLKDAETGQRGYLITGVDSYLAPYTAAREEVQDHLDAVRGLTSDNPVQQDRLTELEPLVAAKFAEMQETIDVRDSQGFEAARAIVVSDEGKAVMDQIRGVLEDVRADEQALLEQRAQESAAAAGATKAVVVGGSALAVVVVVALATFLTRSITRPIGELTARLREIADGDGDLTQQVDDSRRDEIGALAAVFNRFVANIAALVRQIGETAGTSSAAAQELSAITAEMSRQSAEAAHQAAAAAAAAEQVSSNVQTVAAASEQMGASIQEIARSASDANAAGHTAVASTDEANATITRLGDSSAAIGGVVALINTIAQQTNLLALNATIEAARAGEAGKGFAVVAGEVKELAQETARATEEITARITQIQADVDVAVAAISTTTHVIGQVNDHQSSIAGSVEEQSATTSEMSNTIAEAAVGATTIADNVRSIADNAQYTVGHIDQIRSSADEVARNSHELDALVGRFRV